MALKRRSNWYPSIIAPLFKKQKENTKSKFDVEKKDLELAKNKAEIEAQEKQNFIKNIIVQIGQHYLLLVLMSNMRCYQTTRMMLLLSFFEWYVAPTMGGVCMNLQ